MMHLATDQEIIVCPDHGDIVVHADKRAVETLLQPFGSSRHLLRKVPQFRVRYLVIA
jgi:hypothetical protein